MAPPRKPDFIKALEGNPGKRKLRGGDRVVIAEPAKRPPFVTGYAAEIWEEITTAAPDVYKSTDAQLLAAFCLACEAHRTATGYLAIEGHVIRLPGPRGKASINPWSAVLRDAAGQIAALGQRLGLNPAARKHLQAPPAKPGSSKFAGMMGVPDDDD